MSNRRTLSDRHATILAIARNAHDRGAPEGACYIEADERRRVRELEKLGLMRITEKCLWAGRREYFAAITASGIEALNERHRTVRGVG